MPEHSKSKVVGIAIMVLFTLSTTAIGASAAGGPTDATAWKTIGPIVIDGNFGEWNRSSYTIFENLEGIAILERDNIPPEPFDLLSPENGATVTTLTPTLDWGDSSDAHSGLDHYEVWLDGVNVENVTVSVYTTSVLSAGDHSWYVVAVDRAGNWRRSESTFTFRIAIPAPEFVVENLSISPEEVGPGEEVTISVNVANVGGIAGTTSVELKINGELIDQETVYLDPGESTKASFTVAMEEGSYSVEVDGLTGSFKVVAPPPVWPIAAAIIAVCVAAAGALWYLRRR